MFLEGFFSDVTEETFEISLYKANDETEDFSCLSAYLLTKVFEKIKNKKI